jgi:ATP-dependent RNA helicase RhlE
MTVEKINQTLYYVDKSNKSKLLLELLDSNEIKSALVFTRTKHGANKLTEILNKSNISVGVIHGNKSQGARVKALNDFKNGSIKVLVATDVAARGIDINELSHVINYEIPEQPESYVHRIGRTGRAGLSGDAISFCCIDEKRNIDDIQRLIKQEIKIVEDHNYPMIETKRTSNNSNRGHRNNNKRNNNNFNKRKTSH